MGLLAGEVLVWRCFGYLGEAQPLSDGLAVSSGVDLQVTVAWILGERGSVSDQRAEDPAPARHAGSVPPPQMLAKSLPVRNSTRPAEMAVSLATAITAATEGGCAASPEGYSRGRIIVCKKPRAVGVPT